MTQKAIVVTRPAGESGFAERLKARGHRIIHEPCTEIFLIHTARQNVEYALRGEPDAVIVTSRHGAQALASLTAMRDLLLICVGESTAQTALSLGFSRAYAAGGTVERMLEHIRSAYDPDSSFLYISGEHVRADLKDLLESCGMRCARVVVYKAEAVRALSDTFAEQLRRGQVGGVTFLSPRAARIFTALVAQAGLSGATGTLRAFALSPAVAESLKKDSWQAVHVAAEPTLASLIDSIDNALELRQC